MRHRVVSFMLRLALSLAWVGGVAILPARAASPAAEIAVDLAQPGPAFPQTMHGVFFEDINYAADGGLYAELVQNRSFQHRAPLYAWAPVGSDDEVELAVADEQPLNASNTRYLRIDGKRPGAGAANRGYDGIKVDAGKIYRASIYARSKTPGAALAIVLVDGQGAEIGKAALDGLTNQWQKLTASITASSAAADGRLQVLVATEGVYDVDMVSLFPEETFQGRENGMRRDLAQLLADLKPGFLRFPGGCIVEGRDLANAYRWKDTIGDVAERKQNWNLWANNESPQYHQTYGLGFFEYFQLAEDIGAEPLPVLNCGMACQARGARHVPLSELAPWVQDAIDLIEFANGAPDTPWGARRAAMGHPEPFGMKYLGVGNEQWSEEYFQRYEAFHKAIHASHPEIKVVSTAGPAPDGDLWAYAWNRFATDTPADLVDEHFYRPPSWFLQQHTRYDSYSRSGPKVFAGEFAAHGTGRRNNLEAALAEAAFMTGLWRNADVVEMACYAPLFARYGNIQWAPDLIWFDNAGSFGTPSYYVQQMFSRNVPQRLAAVTLKTPDTKPRPLAGRIGVGTWRTQAEFKDIRVVAADGKTLYEFTPEAGLEPWERHNGQWSIAGDAIRQTSEAENVRLFIGDRAWQDYTLTLKARKLAGAEGFLISFAAGDPNSPMWWNLGGWNNTLHGLEIYGATAAQVRGAIEPDRWYDIRIEVKGAEVACYLDGKLVQQHVAERHPSLYAAAGYNDADAQLVLAVANPTADAVTAAIATTGRRLRAGAAEAEVLAGDDPSLENSLEAPRRVAPRQERVTVDGAGAWQREFPPYSLTILKLPTAAE